MAQDHRKFQFFSAEFEAAAVQNAQCPIAWGVRRADGLRLRGVESRELSDSQAFQPEMPIYSTVTRAPFSGTTRWPRGLPSALSMTQV